MAMTQKWITMDDCTDEDGNLNGKKPSVISKMNLAAMRARKDENDSNDVKTRGYGTWLNDSGVIENLDHEARLNAPENLAMVKGQEPTAIGYYDQDSGDTELSKPNWQSSEEIV